MRHQGCVPKVVLDSCLLQFFVDDGLFLDYGVYEFLFCFRFDEQFWANMVVYFCDDTRVAFDIVYMILLPVLIVPHFF